MLKHIGTVSLAVYILCSVFVTVLCQPSKQEDINAISTDLKVEILVGTNHEATDKYDLTFILTNTGSKRILDKSDWVIMFSLKGRNLLINPTYELYGLQILPAEGCLYVITPSATATTPFPGINPEAGFKFTIEAGGLSIFRTDFYPRFSVYSESTTPKTIQQTDYDDLRFVKLMPVNDSFTDDSKMTGIRRSMTQPDIVDMGRVPPTVVLPAPRDISRPTENLIDLSTTTHWYIWPDAQVTDDFKNLFIQKIKTAPNITNVQFTFVTSEPPAGADRIYLRIAPAPRKSVDSYTLAIRPMLRGIRNFNLIHMSATHTKGMNNALESLMSVLGLYNIMPEITIDDEARFERRSVMLDVTKNFIPVSIVKKLLDLMKMYKLNNLVLNLADDYGWRLQLPSDMNFNELWTFGSKRCIDQEVCLPPAFGSGTSSSTTGSGFYTSQEFEGLLQYAKSLFIQITPKLNFMGGIRSATLASHKRYLRLKDSNPASADRFHLQFMQPVLQANELPEDSCYVDGILDPCNTITYDFLNQSIRTVAHLYSAANVSFDDFHAGGDATTKFFGRFPSCMSQNVDQVAAMARMLQGMQQMLQPFGAKLRVDEEAVINPTTGTCIPPSGNGFDGTAMTVDFWNLMPGSDEDWDLTPEQLAFIDAPIEPPPMPTPGSPQPPTMPQPDPLKPYTGATKGLAPWSKAYNCANQGYKVVLAPENFFSMDSAYEMDFYEPGNRYKNRYHIINLHRMMMFEPLNVHINQDKDSGKSKTYLPYRLCKVFQCESLTAAGRQNIVGLEATLDTAIVRTEEQMWNMLLPRLLLFAEKAWRRAPFEDLVRAEDPASLVNVSNVEQRAFFLNQEMINFINNIGYKESGRLDAGKFMYRVARPAASIYFGLPFRIKPPYPVVVKVDFAGADIEFRQLGSGAQWKKLFTRNEMTGQITGGYNFTFPISNQKIEIRTKSSDGTRGSIPTLLSASSFNLFPREIPIEFREGTCLPIAEGWRTDLAEISLDQWNKLLNNIDSVVGDERGFAEERIQNLTQALTRHNQRFNMNVTMPQAFMGIEALMAQGYNITELPDQNAFKRIFMADMRITENRGRFIERRFDSWEAAYQACLRAKQSGNNAGGAGGAAAGRRQQTGRRAQQTRGQARGGRGQTQTGNRRQGQRRNVRPGAARRRQ